MVNNTDEFKASFSKNAANIGFLKLKSEAI